MEVASIRSNTLSTMITAIVALDQVCIPGTLSYVPISKAQVFNSSSCTVVTRFWDVLPQFTMTDVASRTTKVVVSASTKTTVFTGPSRVVEVAIAARTIALTEDKVEPVIPLLWPVIHFR
jgi:hypothetical protein